MRLQDPSENMPQPPSRGVSPRLAAGVLLVLDTGLGAVSTGIDPESSLRFWQLDAEGLSVRLVQRLPDQIRAFFLGRGFGSGAADRFARSCVFQTILRHPAEGIHEGTLGVDLAEWVVERSGDRHPLALAESWDLIWAEMGELESARIAFRWALFPTQQEFEPGDYNWGMISFGLPPGSPFDLHLKWRLGDREVVGTIEGIDCALDADSNEPR